MTIGLLAAFLIAPITALSQQQIPCAPREKVVSGLAKSYQEQPVARGLAANGNMFEVFSSEHGETYSIIITRIQDGQQISCFMSSGENWQAIQWAPSTEEGAAS